jgi:DNA gyrase subunit A
MVTARGQAIRFNVKTLRSASRLSGGVRGIKLKGDDRVVALEIARKGRDLLVVTEKGHGKRTPMDDYPTHGRGGQGVITFKITPKTGELVRARAVDPEHELMMVSEGGIMLRTPVKHISQQGRPTQGVTLMDVDDDRVAAIAIVDMRKELPSAEEQVATDGDGKAPAKKKRAPAKPKPKASADGKASKNGPSPRKPRKK